ncbi:TPA: hypothetical protein U1C23_002280 [Streptococcus suis]|nr:hypothetical protein [Streptococcus suis]
MSNFYYMILKNIQNENPLKNRIAYYASQFTLILLSITLIGTTVESIKYSNSKNSIHFLIYIFISFCCFKLYNHQKLKQAKLLANIAKTIKDNYDLNDLASLKDELENNLDKTNEILKWVSLILASVTTLTIGQFVNFYLKSLDFLSKEIKDKLVREIFKTNIFTVMHNLLVPLTLLITGYILFIFFSAQLFNHNKRLTLLVLRNCDYTL